MPSLIPNIENRVRKLPKPSTHSQALQPLFEAVSNALFAVEDLFGNDTRAKGKVEVLVEHLENEKEFSVVVSDNGIGLNEPRFNAFCTIDTDFKRAKGGKGVGRLFWLDAFASVLVESYYFDGTTMQKRSFEFALGNEEQIRPIEPTKNELVALADPGTRVTFRGFRSTPYREQFPKRSDTFLRYFSAHFIADFLVGSGPTVTVNIDGQRTDYPSAISDLVEGEPLETEPFHLEEFGDFVIKGFSCAPEASTGLEGNHQLHLLANGRTVETRKIDGLIGMDSIGAPDGPPRYFHGCLSGEYLDERVNEGRTAFNIPERVLKELSRQCVEKAKEQLLTTQVVTYTAGRRRSYEEFVARHPIYAFDTPEVQLARIPFSATKAEDFAAGLVKHQIRRDENRQRSIEQIIKSLDSGESVPDDFGERVVSATENLQAAEKLSLAQHVVRRKLVLELMEKLIARVRQREGGQDGYHLERTLHSLLCPMNTRGDDPLRIESQSHDLWIVDERLAFTRAFSSDKRLDKVLVEGGSADRPDLFLWDLSYGLGVVDPYRNQERVDTSEPLKKMMIVEFKRPGRRDYVGASDQIETQISRYLSQLRGGEIESFNRERVRIASDCVFYCYVVADIVGDLELQLTTWRQTANGQGRIRYLEGEFRGSIEVIQWRDLVNDAWARNQATLHAAGLRRF